MKKVKWGRFIKKHLNGENIKILLLGIPLGVLLFRKIISGDVVFEDYFDTAILVSFLVAFLCESLATLISKVIHKKIEDAVKLTEDYEGLTDKWYNGEKLLEYHGKKFPVIELFTRTGDSSPFSLVIDHSHMDKEYVLPDRLNKHYDWIMKAHSSSVVFNRWNIRLDDVYEKNGQINLLYSRTMYYYSLATNRAMDYALENGETVREMYEPGPYLSALAVSKLSNHLGFNGFIETSDKKFIFVRRDNNLSIGKNTLSTSVAASMKTEYCLDTDRKLVLRTLSDSIRQEISKELKIYIPENVDMCRSIFAFYRDLVEGGKPQFLFHYKADITAAEFEGKIKKEKKNKTNVEADGTVFYFRSLDELKASTIYPGKIVFGDGKSYKMMPSASASVVMLLKYFGEQS